MALVVSSFVCARDVRRFKEHLMWLDDAGEYFSSSTRKYLEYNNDRADVSAAEEMAAIKNALRVGRATNRVVILPELHCHGCTSEGCLRA